MPARKPSVKATKPRKTVSAAAKTAPRSAPRAAVKAKPAPRKPAVRAWKDVLAAMMPEEGYLQFRDVQEVDENGKPKIEIVSADFGPLPAPEGINAAISAMIQEAYTGAIGPVATGLRIQTISIADGIMTISGRIR